MNFKKVVTTEYHLTCNCGNSISLSEKEWKSDSCVNYKNINGWKIEVDTGYFRNDFKESARSIMCPVCVERKRQEDLKSADMIVRIDAGYYDDISTDFYEDLWNEFAMDVTEIQKKKINDLVWEEDTYQSKYYKMKELYELLTAI